MQFILFYYTVVVKNTFNQNITYTQPEVLLCVVLSADRFMVLQLLKHHRAATSRGGAFLGLGRSKWALTD